MKTENYRFIIELPDGEEIISDEYEYEYLEHGEIESNDYCDVLYDSHEDMLEQMENDKIEFVFNSLSIRHKKI